MTLASAGAQHRPVRHAGWLELFFDLVFVAVAAQLAHALHGDPGGADFGRFLALYFPAWWVWINITFFANLFEGDSARRRLLMLVAMLCLALMSAAVPDAFGDRAPAYALGYAGTRVVLWMLWGPETRLPGPGSLPRWRPVAYCLGSGALWAVSAVVPAPGRYVLWAVSLAFEIVLLLSYTWPEGPGRLHAGHLVERVGLFVIIVLGESVVSLITAADHAWTAASGIVAVVGFILLTSLWWSYFDFASSSAERVLDSVQRRDAYLLARDTAGFLHFFVTAGIIAMAAGLASAVEEAGHPHLAHGAVVAVAGGQALYHTAHAAIALRYGRRLPGIAVWALPGICIPLLVIVFSDSLSPLLAIVVLAAESLGHLLWARLAVRRGRITPLR